LPHLGSSQRFNQQRHRSAAVQVGERLEARVIALEVLEAHRPEHEHLRPGDSRREKREEIEGGKIGPLQVVENQDERHRKGAQ